MNIHVDGLSVGLLAALAGIVLLISLGTMCIFAIVERISVRRRSRNRDHVHNVRHFGFFRSGLVAAIVVGIMLMYLMKARSVHDDETDVSVAVAVEAEHEFHEAMQDLSDARQEMQKAARDASKEIPVEIVAIESASPDSATMAATSADPGEPANPDVELSADTEEMRKRKSELAAHIGQWVNSFLGKSTQESTAVSADAAQAAESANGDVVVLQLSDQIVAQLLGESGQKLLKSFNSELPGRIRQTYALIPLTPSVDAAVSPMRPLLANGGLEAIANSLVSIVERAESENPGEKRTETTTAVTVTAALTDRAMPAWVLNPDGGRIVVETGSLLPGDDSQRPLVEAINAALEKHLAVFSETLDPVLRNQTRFVTLELDRETAERCIVEKFERHEELETGVEGRKSFRKVYALLEFPESVDKVAVQKIRQSVQNDRMAGLGIVVACVWLSICSAGCSVRLWRNGTRLLRVTATPIAGIASLLLLLIAAGFVIALSTGQAPRPPWSQNEPAVEIHVDAAVSSNDADLGEFQRRAGDVSPITFGTEFAPVVNRT